MNKYLIAVLGLIVVLMIVLVGFNGLKTTGSLLEGKCWEAQSMDDYTINGLRSLGCIVEEDVCSKYSGFCTHKTTTTKVCCQFEDCPSVDEIFC